MACGESESAKHKVDKAGGIKDESMIVTTDIENCG